MDYARCRRVRTPGIARNDSVDKHGDCRNPEQDLREDGSARGDHLPVEAKSKREPPNAPDEKRGGLERAEGAIGISADELSYWIETRRQDVQLENPDEEIKPTADGH